MLLYAITDRSAHPKASLYEMVEAAIKGGATFIQLREKKLSDDELLDEAIAIRPLCKKYNVPFVINDRVDIAIKANADGVHLGQGDGNVVETRRLLGDDKIIGVSAHNVEEALKAQSEGASYLGVGAAFATGTKGDANRIEHRVIKDICSAVEIPVVAIGGINKSNILQLCSLGLSGVAVVSAIFGADDIEKAATELMKLAKIAAGK